MAALAPLSATPARQPFGVLDSSKLRSLQSVKNCQNGMGTDGWAKANVLTMISSIHFFCTFLSEETSCLS